VVYSVVELCSCRSLLIEYKDCLKLVEVNFSRLIDYIF